MTGAEVPLVIRSATAQDRFLLSELGAETFSESFGAQNTAQDMQLYLARSFSPDIQAAELADPSTTFLIAEVGGEPVGYARLREGGSPAAISASHPIEIVRFYARRRWIGRRVGAALMQECLSQAHARGCDVIWLDVWERNDRAIAFYQKWGFAEVGDQPFRLGGDIQRDLLMARPILLRAEAQESSIRARHSQGRR